MIFWGNLQLCKVVHGKSNFHFQILVSSLENLASARSV